jgi:type IV secretion system protein VirB5
MSSSTLPIEARLTPQQSLLTDEVGNEVYASHYAERKAYRFAIGCGAVMLLASIGMNIAYTDLNYSPREGEIRTYLTDWANYRYTIGRDTIGKKYALNYYFLSQTLASQLMAKDNANHVVSQVMAGQIEQSDVEVKNVTITSMSQETVQGTAIARGTALVAIDKLYSPTNSREPRTEHWLLSITYYLNPKQVSDQAKVFPQFETINPLGLTVTEFHENRISVDPIPPGATTANSITNGQRATGGPR